MPTKELNDVALLSVGPVLLKILQLAATGEPKYRYLDRNSTIYASIAASDGAEAFLRAAGFDAPVGCTDRLALALTAQSSLQDAIHSLQSALAKTCKPKVVATTDCPPNVVTDLLAKGDAVIAHSLVGTYDNLNGQIGCVHSDPSSSGSVCVRFTLADGTVQEASIRLAQLRLVAKQSLFIPVDRLEAPRHIDPSLFDFLKAHATEKRPAVRDVKYWGGDTRPWRMGTSDAPIEDEALIAEEKLRKEAVESEDAGAGWDAEALHACGMRVDLLLAMTFSLNLWEWKTWEVVQFLVKPATESRNRCRFIDLAEFRPYKGPSKVFISHCWGGKWGDLIGACASGARWDRLVWLDVFAVRQWPGNGGDLDFRGVIARCRALVAASAPLPGKISEKHFTLPEDSFEYLSSKEYAAAKRQLPFTRLWCIVELYSALQCRQGIIFRCLGAQHHGDVVRLNSKGARFMLSNFSFRVDVSKAEAAVEADRVRELKNIGEANFADLNRTVASALRTGGLNDRLDVLEVDAFACGETEALSELPPERLGAAFRAAAAAGQVHAMNMLFRRRGNSEFSHGLPNLLANSTRLAAGNGQIAAVEYLRDLGADIHEPDPNGANTAFLAASNGHAKMLALLGEWGVDLNRQNDAGTTGCYLAVQYGFVDVMEVFERHGLLAPCPGKASFVMVAASRGRLEALRLLKELGHDLDKTETNIWGPEHLSGDPMRPIQAAAINGHVECMEFLREWGASLTNLIEDAFSGGNISVLSKLKDWELHVGPKSRTGLDRALLAAQEGQADTIKFLHDCGIDVESSRDEGRVAQHCDTPALIAVSIGVNRIPILSKLREIGVNLDRPNKFSWTPFLAAAVNCNVDALKYLISVGVNKHGSTRDGHTAAHLVVLKFTNSMHMADLESKRVAALELLRDSSCRLDVPDRRGKRPAYYAAGNGQVELLEVLHGRADFNARDAEGASPACFAADKGEAAALRFLLEHGADPSVPRHDGATPALLAAIRGHVAALEVLFLFGADIDAPTPYGTPYEKALSEGLHENVLEYLESVLFR